jgi:hypothetical protein
VHLVISYIIILIQFERLIIIFAGQLIKIWFLNALIFTLHCQARYSVDKTMCCVSNHLYIQILTSPPTSNVKTVKDNRATNVSTSNMNETKTSEFVNESTPSKDIMSICSRRADSGPNRNNLFWNDTKTFRFRFQNDIGTFVLSFLTLLLPTAMIEHEFNLRVSLKPSKFVR